MNPDPRKICTLAGFGIQFDLLLARAALDGSEPPSYRITRLGVPPLDQLREILVAVGVDSENIEQWVLAYQRAAPDPTFLCHSSDDKRRVRELRQRLAADGFPCWLDEDNILPGQDWDREIRRAVKAARHILVCLSQASATKTGYVQKELAFALDRADEQPEGSIFLIPVRLEPCKIPERLGRWQAVNLFEPKGYEQLVRSLLQSRPSDVEEPVGTGQGGSHSSQVAPDGAAAPEAYQTVSDEDRLNELHELYNDLAHEVDSRQFAGEHYDDGIGLMQLRKARDRAEWELEEEERRQGLR